MFWKLKSKSCRIKLQKVKTISEFEALLNSLAAEIWNECQYHHCLPDQFSCDHIPLDETQGVAFIANGLQKYIRDLECGSYGVSFMVYSEYDIQEYGDEELADRISNFFFLKSDLEYFLGQCVQFDQDRGYADQWITFRNGGSTKTMSTDSFIDGLLQNNKNMSRVIEEVLLAAP